MSAYAIAYAYEFLYCFFAGLPTDFIAVSPRNIFVAAVSIMFLPLVLLLMGAQRYLVDSVARAFPRAVRVASILGFLGSVIIVVFFRGTAGQWAGLATVAVVWFVLVFAWSLPDVRPNPVNAESAFETLLAIARRLRLRHVYLLVSPLVVLSSLAEAGSFSRLPLLEGTPEYVVLRTYGDLMITAEVDRAHKKFGKTVVLRKVIPEGESSTRVHLEDFSGFTRER